MALVETLLRLFKDEFLMTLGKARSGRCLARISVANMTSAVSPRFMSGMPSGTCRKCSVNTFTSQPISHDKSTSIPLEEYSVESDLDADMIGGRCRVQVKA